MLLPRDGELGFGLLGAGLLFLVQAHPTKTVFLRNLGKVGLTFDLRLQLPDALAKGLGLVRKLHTFIGQHSGFTAHHFTIRDCLSEFFAQGLAFRLQLRNAGVFIGFKCCLFHLWL